MDTASSSADPDFIPLSSQNHHEEEFAPSRLLLNTQLHKLRPRRSLKKTDVRFDPLRRSVTPPKDNITAESDILHLKEKDYDDLLQYTTILAERYEKQKGEIDRLEKQNDEHYKQDIARLTEKTLPSWKRCETRLSVPGHHWIKLIKDHVYCLHCNVDREVLTQLKEKYEYDNPSSLKRSFSEDPQPIVIASGPTNLILSSDDSFQSTAKKDSISACNDILIMKASEMMKQ